MSVMWKLYSAHFVFSGYYSSDSFCEIILRLVISLLVSKWELNVYHGCITNHKRMFFNIRAESSCWPETY